MKKGQMPGDKCQEGGNDCIPATKGFIFLTWPEAGGCLAGTRDPANQGTSPGLPEP